MDTNYAPMTLPGFMDATCSFRIRLKEVEQIEFGIASIMPQMYNTVHWSFFAGNQCSCYDDVDISALLSEQCVLGINEGL